MQTEEEFPLEESYRPAPGIAPKPKSADEPPEGPGGNKEE